VSFFIKCMFDPSLSPAPYPPPPAPSLSPLELSRCITSKAAAQASRQMGGAVQLERKPKTIQLAGFPVPDPSSGGGATAVVECFADEVCARAFFLFFSFSFFLK